MVSSISIQQTPRFGGVQPEKAQSAANTNIEVGTPVLHPVRSAAASPVNFQALVAPQIKPSSAIKFGSILTDKDYVVNHRLRVPVNAYSVSKTLRALMLRDFAKREQNDPSTLKYSLSAYSRYWDEDEAALGDNLILLDRPVDVVIEDCAGPASVFPLMMSRLTDEKPEEGLKVKGHCFINKDAAIALGPVRGYVWGKNHDQQISAELMAEYLRDRESLIMLVSGETDRQKVSRHLNGEIEFNALQSLAYGKYGLVDAVLIGKDKVLTRKGLERFYADMKYDADKIAEFNDLASNIDRIVERKNADRYLTPLADYAPGSLVPEAVSREESRAGQYLSFRELDLPRMENNTDAQLENIRHVTSDRLNVLARPLDDPRFKLMPRLPFLNAGISATPDIPSQIKMVGAIPSPGLIYDDVILYNDGFDDVTAEQIHQSLLALQEKKEAQADPSNIKILINSPGGSVWAGNGLRSRISQLSVPVDVIVQGMAASCGAYLLASATGNRFATPNARIMIHQAASGHSGNAQSVLEAAKGTKDATREIVAAVAKASGRAPAEVWADFKQDTWLNPLEAMFYGKKGLLDGVMVGPNRVVTRKEVLDYLENDPDVQAFLTEKYGKDGNVEKFLKDRLRQLRKPNPIVDATEWEKVKGRDPFENPLRTLMAAAAKARKLEEIPELRGSVTRPQEEEIDQFVIGRKPVFLFDLEDMDDDMKAYRGTGWERFIPDTDPPGGR